MRYWLFVSNGFCSLRSERETSVASLLAFSIILFVVVCAWRIYAYIEYNKAKEEFLKNPADPGVKQNLISAARNNARNWATNEVMGLIEEQHDAERSESSKKQIGTELEKLADLHRQGHLTDAEFGSAKAKLLK